MQVVIEFWPAVGFGVSFGVLFLIGCHWIVNAIEDATILALEKEFGYR